ncbi:hypothetical protein [Salsipaludibacter albus]|uniref:hypothetical protein n=1 Tax=Salsipaludibacter albus TaxID=2849650 RepID=UPI001EE441A7|nr:hypothetical protein [Salsipaludibacter albus]MBY5161279.1 hypothetical protein [Salsipaludibacter albus]
MITLERGDARLTVPNERLVDLAQLATGTASAVPEDLVDAGLVDPDGTVEPLVAAMATLAVAPVRATVVERFDGTVMKPLFVAWGAGGRATLSEPDAQGNVVVTATQLRLVPALLLQWTNLQARAEPEGRSPLTTTAHDLDALLRPGDGRPVPAALDRLADAWRLAWRATGSWGEHDADTVVTVVDTGTDGVWVVDHPPRSGDEDVPVTLEPVTVARATELLGDVVTGRRADPPPRSDTAAREDDR